MAGTMPHAIFIEPEVDGPGTFAAYAAELPGCAVFATSDDEAAARMPQPCDKRRARDCTTDVAL